MSRIKGELRVCDRCGRMEFFRLVGTSELDGGYTHINRFEEAKGWDNIHGIGDLCPACVDEWKKVKEDFQKKVKNGTDTGIMALHSL